MNLFQLVLKQMRQRALSTSLTLLSVVLGSALAIGVIILQRESGNLFVQTDFGYDVLVGIKGSPMQLVLNTIYHVDVSQGNIPYVLFEGLRNDRANVKLAVPYVVGDTYKGHRVVGTSPAFFGFDEESKPVKGYDDKGHLLPGFSPPPLPGEPDPEDTSKVAASTFQYRRGKRFTIAQGRIFHPRKFEAVIGSDIAAATGLKIGDKFKVAHDAPAGAPPDEHDEQWEVVGVLDPTHTAEDKVVFIPLISFYAIPQHEQVLESDAAAKSGTPAPVTPKPKPDHPEKPGDKPTAHHDEHDHEEAYDLNPDGTISLKLTKDKWQLSAILIRARSTNSFFTIQNALRKGEVAMAVNPANVMREFFITFLEPSTRVLMVVVLVVVVTAAVSILVSIYNAIANRTREIAIMRALGATRGKILTLICVEAGMIGLIGGVIGALIGHGLGAVISTVFERRMGTGINWLAISSTEWLYLAGVVALSVLAGLVPGLKAYRTPVATNLVAG